MATVDSTTAQDELAPFALNRETRRGVCIHEAAHAVVAALGGMFVHTVEVAPVRATEWTTINRKGGTRSDLWGRCETSDPPISLMGFVEWYGFAGEKVWDAMAARQFQAELLSHFSRTMRAEYYRAIRAYLCLCLAGPIADGIHADEEPWLESEYGETPDDAGDAEITCALLPFRSEFDHAVKLTTGALLENWGFVIRLADALESAGRLEDEVGGYLPPAIKGWPWSPNSARGREG